MRRLQAVEGGPRVGWGRAAIKSHTKSRAYTLMIAKFHSAPGHSMETTLTINLPPRQSVRTGGGTEQQPKKEPKDRSISKKAGDHKTHNVSYKDKFQKMREKYDKVTLTHENHSRDLELLNNKIKKLQAENDLLLDSIYVSDPDLFTRYFPASSSPSHNGPPPPPTQATYHPSAMRPPPPPLISAASSSATGTTTTSQQPSMPPPFSPMTMAPPPTSATTNGTSSTVRGSHSHSHSHSHSSSRRQSTESSSQGGRVPTERRRRSDAHGHGHGGGTPSAPRTPTQGHRSGSGMMHDERGMRSPRTNGASMQTRSPMAALPMGAGVGMPMNGLRSPQMLRRQSDVAPPPPMLISHEDDIMAERERERERDVFRREPPLAMNDEDGYNAYAAVNSPDDEEEDDDSARAKMEMDP